MKLSKVDAIEQLLLAVTDELLKIKFDLAWSGHVRMMKAEDTKEKIDNLRKQLREAT